MGAILIQKSKENIKAAETLIVQHQLYASSVHCSYYSCVQIMKFIATQILSITPRKIDEDSRSTPGGTHVYLIANVFKPLLEERDDVKRMNAVKLKKKIEKLKENRKMSDYEDFKIIKDFADLSLNEAKEVKKMLIDLHNINEEEWES